MDTDQSPLQRWYQLVENQNIAGLDDILADQVVFHSPVVFTPQEGKALTTLYLTAAFHVFFNEKFRYVREVVSDTQAVLEFVTEIEGIHVNGVDMIQWDKEGKIVDFKVMLRPLKAINLIHRMMAEMLEKTKTDFTEGF